MEFVIEVKLTQDSAVIIEELVKVQDSDIIILRPILLSATQTLNQLLIDAVKELN